MKDTDISNINLKKGGKIMKLGSAFVYFNVFYAVVLLLYKDWSMME